MSFSCANVWWAPVPLAGALAFVIALGVVALVMRNRNGGGMPLSTDLVAAVPWALGIALTVAAIALAAIYARRCATADTSFPILPSPKQYRPAPPGPLYPELPTGAVIGEPYPELVQEVPARPSPVRLRAPYPSPVRATLSSPRRLNEPLRDIQTRAQRRQEKGYGEAVRAGKPRQAQLNAVKRVQQARRDFARAERDLERTRRRQELDARRTARTLQRDMRRLDDATAGLQELF